VAREEAKKAKDAERAMKAAELAAAGAKKRDKDKAAVTQTLLYYLKRPHLPPSQRLSESQSQSAVHCSCEVVILEVRGHLSLHKKRQELGQLRHLIDILSRPKALHYPIYSFTSNSCDNNFCGWLYSSCLQGRDLVLVRHSVVCGTRW
jgi:hypothetical protein